MNQSHKKVSVKAHQRKSKLGKITKVRSHIRKRKSLTAKQKAGKEFVNISKLRKLNDHEFNFQGRKYRFEVYSDGKNKWIWKPFSKSFSRAPQSTNRFAAEVVASQLGKELGLNVVENHYAIKTSNGQKQFGIISKFVENSENLKERFFTDKKVTNDIFMFVPFEIWLKSTDRHLSQYVLKNKKAFALDFEQSLNKKHKNYQIGHLAVVMGKGVEPLDEKEMRKVLKDIQSLKKSEIRDIVELPDESNKLDKEEKAALKSKEKEIEKFLESEQDDVVKDLNSFTKVRKEFEQKNLTKKKKVSQFRKEHFWGSENKKKK